jgi:hypothetical protein
MMLSCRRRSRLMEVPEGSTSRPRDLLPLTLERVDRERAP